MGTRPAGRAGPIIGGFYVVIGIIGFFVAVFVGENPTAVRAA